MLTTLLIIFAVVFVVPLVLAGLFYVLLGAVKIFKYAKKTSEFIGIVLYFALWILATPFMAIACLIAGYLWWTEDDRKARRRDAEIVRRHEGYRELHEEEERQRDEKERRRLYDTTPLTDYEQRRGF